MSYLPTANTNHQEGHHLMKIATTKSLIGCLLLMVSLFTFAEAEAEKTYKIGVVPQFDAKKVHQIWSPILQQLRDETGKKFELRASTTIPEFENALTQGEFDFAYMNPYHLLMANQSAGYVPLVRDHSRQLTGILVVSANSKIESPKDLNGLSIAFPAPNALGASLQMRQELNDIYQISFTPKFVKTHDAVYLNVLLNETAAGGGVMGTLRKQSAQIQNALKVIHETKPVAPHPFAALKTVPAELRQQVAQIMIDFAATDIGKDALKKIPINQIGAATLEDYQSLAEMGLERFYVAPVQN
jgi:phosphonate transport system substrate-binding protein